MEKELSFYRFYHQNIINKWIHFFCIPMIIISIIIYLDNFYILYEKLVYKGRFRRTYYKFKLINFILIYYIFFYFKIRIIVGIMMTIYFYILINFAYLLIDFLPENFVTKIAHIMFVFGWVLQFIGHYIEGRKPALLDSISQAFFQAPLFSLEFLFPYFFT